MLVYQPSQPVQNPVLMLLVRIYYIHQTLIHRGLRWRLSQIYRVPLFKLQFPLWVSMGEPHIANLLASTRRHSRDRCSQATRFSPLICFRVLR